jgi:hypothetical protein
VGRATHYLGNSALRNNVSYANEHVHIGVGDNNAMSQIRHNKIISATTSCVVIKFFARYGFSSDKRRTFALHYFVISVCRKPGAVRSL